MPDPARRLTTQGVERKQQLLDAAARLFAERGYAETRIVDICREAGVAKGLFYWYFETKEAVFRDLAGDLRLRLRRAQAAAMDPDADPLVRIRQGSEASVRFMAAHAQAFALIAVENVDRQFVDDIRRGTEVHADDTERLVRAAIDAGLVRDEDPRLLAYAVLTTVGWFATSTGPAASTSTSTSSPPSSAGRWCARSPPPRRSPSRRCSPAARAR